MPNKKQMLTFLLAIMLTIPALAIATTPTNFDIKVGTFSKRYPIVPAPGNKSIGIVYLYDLNDNYRLASQIAKDLSAQIQKSGVLKHANVLLMPGDSANMLGTLLYQNLLKHKPDLKFCIVRSSAKGGSYKNILYQSITSGVIKELHLREDQYNIITKKNVIIFDDVISTGATLKALQDLINQSHGSVLAYACFATEGKSIEKFNNKPLFKMVHLPTVALNS